MYYHLCGLRFHRFSSLILIVENEGMKFWIRKLNSEYSCSWFSNSIKAVGIKGFRAKWNQKFHEYRTLELLTELQDQLLLIQEFSCSMEYQI